MNPKDKNERKRLIRSIIRDMRVGSQEELTDLLAEKGIEVTQATLSRDLRDMKIVKLHSSEGYFYSLPAVASASNALHVADGILSVEVSGQMAVLKTQPAFANVVASVIDGAAIPQVMGTVAGDDTVLVVLKAGTDGKAVLESIGNAIPGIREKLVR